MYISFLILLSDIAFKFFFTIIYIRYPLTYFLHYVKGIHTPAACQSLSVHTPLAALGG